MAHQNILYIRRVLIQVVVNPFPPFGNFSPLFNDILNPQIPKKKSKK